MVSNEIISTKDIIMIIFMVVGVFISFLVFEKYEVLEKLIKIFKKIFGGYYYVVIYIMGCIITIIFTLLLFLSKNEK